MPANSRHKPLMPETSCSWHPPAPASTSSRTTSIVDASSRTLSINCSAALKIHRTRRSAMPRRLENDKWLFGVTLGLCLLGAVMIFSASAVTAENDFHHSYYFLLRQSAWLFIGLAGMFVRMRTDYRRLREPAVVYTVLCLVGLMLVGAFFLDKSHATHRWIRFGPIGIQPSESAKLAVILYLAWFLDLKRRNAAAMEFRKDDFVNNILPAIGPILVCVALILAQPDLGTSVDIMLIAAAVLYVAGMSWKWIAAGAVAAVPALYLLITHVAYRQGRLLALGITAMVIFQALINFAVVLGMVPTKGIPLPFISYGGSSLLVMLLATGVLLNISQQSTTTR